MDKGIGVFVILRMIVEVAQNIGAIVLIGDTVFIGIRYDL